MIDFENTTPTEVFKTFPEHRKEILAMWILKLKDNPNEPSWKEFVIPSILCEKLWNWENWKRYKYYFPFYHQVFWFLLQELKDVKFALSELQIIKWNWYTFPNWNFVEVIKN